MKVWSSKMLGNLPDLLTTVKNAAFFLFNFCNVLLQELPRIFIKMKKIKLNKKCTYFYLFCHL